MDSEEVLILGVDESIDCLCLGKRDKYRRPSDVECIEITQDLANGKGKQPANPFKRVKRKGTRDLTPSQDDGDVIIIGDNKHEMLPDSLNFDTLVPPTDSTLPPPYQYGYSPPPLGFQGTQLSTFPLLAPQCNFPSVGGEVETDSAINDISRMSTLTKPDSNPFTLSCDVYTSKEKFATTDTLTLSQSPSLKSLSSSATNTSQFTNSNLNSSPTDNSTTTSHTDSSSSNTGVSSDFEVAMQFDKDLNKYRTPRDPSAVLEDEQLARKLQAEEYADVEIISYNAAKQISCDEKLAREMMIKDLQSVPETPIDPYFTTDKDATGVVKSEECTPSDSDMDQQMTDANNSTIKENDAPSTSKTASQSTAGYVSGLERMPTCWTPCPNCHPTEQRRYHVIEVAQGSSEWNVVTDQLTRAHFIVVKVKRIQNDSLWQRLCYEKQLMLRERDDVNMQLLYHTTRADTSVICEEGLDLRLSRNGLFGNGIYFRLVNMLFFYYNDKFVSKVLCY